MTLIDPVTWLGDWVPIIGGLTGCYFLLTVFVYVAGLLREVDDAL